MENFYPCENMSSLQVNHINGNKLDNSIDNLEWVTCQENIDHAIKNNLRAKVNGAAKLTPNQVLEIVDLLLSKKYTYKQISEIYGLNEETVARIKRKESWVELTKDIDFN